MIWGELVQESKSAALFLAYFWFKNYHMQKAKVRIKTNKNASHHPQANLRSCSIKKLSLERPHLWAKNLFVLSVSSIFLHFFFFYFSSGLQFIKTSCSQAGFDIHSTATNLGPNSRSLWQCPEQLSRDWLMRTGAGMSLCTLCHLAENRHQHRTALLPSVLATQLGDVFLLLAAEE